MPDDKILKLDTLLQPTQFEAFIDDYENAKQIAKELISKASVVSKKELERKVIDVLKEIAPEDSAIWKEIDLSYDQGRLAEDFPSCTGFIDFVKSAVEEVGGRVLEDKIDKYQEEDFLNLLDEGVSWDELTQILKLREIKNRDIFVEYQNSFNDQGSISKTLPRDLESFQRKLRQTRDDFSDPPTVLELKEIKRIQENILYLETMGLFSDSRLHICLRINAIFKRRHKEVDEAVSQNFEKQRQINGQKTDMSYEDMMNIVHRHPEEVGEFLPLLEEMGEYGAVLTLIKKKPDLAMQMSRLFVDKDSDLNEEARRYLLKIYSDHSGLSELGNTADDIPLEVDNIQARISRSNNPEVIKNYLLENQEMVQKLTDLLPSDQKVNEVGRGIEGHAMVILDKSDDRYLLVKIIPTPQSETVVDVTSGREDSHIDFESYYLYLFKNGTIQSDQSPRYFDKGYLLRETSQIREEDLIEAIFKRLKGEVSDDYDMCDVCGFTDYALSQ